MAGPCCAAFVLALCCLILGTTAASFDVTVVANSVSISGCLDLRSGSTEHVTWKWVVDGRETGCQHNSRYEDQDATFTVNWKRTVTTTSSSIGLALEVFTKGDNTDVCQYFGLSDVGHKRDQYTIPLSAGSTSHPSYTINGDEDWYGGAGHCSFSWSFTVSVQESASLRLPYITSASIAGVNDAEPLALTINGNNLKPDAIDPSVTITGFDVDCPSFVSASDSQLVCSLTAPPSQEINGASFQVMVQTTLGTSNTKKVTWPLCTHSPCSNNGRCYWSASEEAQECQCYDELKHYGPACQHTYPEGTPVLIGVMGYGGDYNEDQVIALEGAVFPGAWNALDGGGVMYDQYKCQVYWDTAGIAVDAKKSAIKEDLELISERDLVPFDVSQHLEILPRGASSMRTTALCMVPKEHLSAPTASRPRAKVRVVWRSSTTLIQVVSARQFTYMLYGSFSPSGSTASLQTNSDNGIIRVFQPQAIKIYSLDSEGKNRVNGGDESRFLLSWRSGPAFTQTGMVIAKDREFHNSDCKKQPENNLCAYYLVEVSFDFSGTFSLNVFVEEDESARRLVAVNKKPLTFEVKGLGEAARSVTSRTSPIEWADKLHLHDIDLYDPSLAQLLSPNTGRADKQNVLGPLFQRWKGGWFSQRQTIGLTIESAPRTVLDGTLHTVMARGVDSADYCDERVDTFAGDAMTTSHVPWKTIDNVPGAFPLTVGGTGGLCVDSMTLSVDVVHSDIDAVSIDLQRVGPVDLDPDSQNVTTLVRVKHAMGSSGGATATLHSLTFDASQLAPLLSKPLSSDYELVVESPANLGYLSHWQLDVGVVNCLQSASVDKSACAKGNGTRYARARNLDDKVVLACPEGGVIDSVVYARYGAIEGSCSSSSAALRVSDQGCEADHDMVKQRVEAVCLGRSSCELNAVDEAFGVDFATPFLCPDQLPPCPPDGLVGDDEAQSAAAGTSKRSSPALPDFLSAASSPSSKKKSLPATTPTAAGRTSPRPKSLLVPGTEDHYFSARYERSSEFALSRGYPMLRKRNGLDLKCSTTTEQRPRNALIAKAQCKDPSGARHIVGSWDADPPIVIASASADFDLDWHDEEITVFGPVGGPMNVRFKSADSSSTFSHTYENIVVGGQAVQLGEMVRVITGDFDADGFAEAVIAYLDPQGDLNAFLWDLRINQAAVWTSTFAKKASSKEPCRCWDLEAQIRDTFQRAQKISFGASPPRFPKIVAGHRLDSAGFSFDISAGDMGFAGIHDLAVAWIEDESTVNIRLFKYDGQLRAVSPAPHPISSLSNPHAVAVAMGNFEGAGYNDLAIAVSQETSVIAILLTIDETDASYKVKQEKDLTFYPSTRPRFWGSDLDTNQRHNVKLATGDLDEDGDDEIVIAITNNEYAFLRRIDSIGSGQKCRKLECMELVGNSETAIRIGPATAKLSRSPEIHMAIGNLDESYSNELIVAVEYKPQVATQAAAEKVQLMKFAPSGAKDLPFVLQGKHCYAGPYKHSGEATQTSVLNNIALTVGNLFARGYRVGSPLKVRMEGVPELIAVMHAPPTHFDYIDGEPLLVNPLTFRGSGSFSQLSRGDDVAVTFTTVTEAGSASASINGFQLDARIGVVFGNFIFSAQSFQSAATSMGFAQTKKLSVRRDMVASGDDAVLYVSTDKDVWKYPIVDQSGHQIGTLDIEYSSSCGERCVQKADGRDLWWYAPDHEVFNLLSYSSRAPRDFEPYNRITVGDKYTVSSNPVEIWVDQRSANGQNEGYFGHNKTARLYGGSAGLDVGLEFTFSSAVLGVGPMLGTKALGISVKAAYAGDAQSADESTTSTSKHATLMKDASVHAYFEGINPEMAYRVQPYVYSARAAGKEYLKLAYSAEPAYYPGLSNWWYATYDLPDPSFNLPWGFSNLPLEKRQRTKDIVSVPPYPKLGEVVEVFVTVRNKALVDAFDVRVSLWKGNPDNCLDAKCLYQQSLIGARIINVIPAQDKRLVDPGFRFKYEGTNNIYATVDDPNLIVEKHEDNNIGYNMLFVDFRKDGFLLQNIRLDSSISAVPVKQDGYTAGYRLSVDILGDSFTRRNVLVQFWYNKVGMGGSLIGTVFLAKVGGSNAKTTRQNVQVHWDTRESYYFGKQTVHAVILHSGTDPAPENIVARAESDVTVECFGEVDVCGVCGGDSSACRGCDGVPMSGRTYDACGKCGGDGSQCCLPAFKTATRHTITVTPTGVSSPSFLRIKAGESVIWENRHDSWNIDITSGLYDSDVGFSTLLRASDASYAGKIEAPPRLEKTLSESDIEKFVQQFTGGLKHDVSGDATYPSASRDPAKLAGGTGKRTSVQANRARSRREVASANDPHHSDEFSGESSHPMLAQLVRSAFGGQHVYRIRPSSDRASRQLRSPAAAPAAGGDAEAAAGEGDKKGGDKGCCAKDKRSYDPESGDRGRFDESGNRASLREAGMRLMNDRLAALGLLDPQSPIAFDASRAEEAVERDPVLSHFAARYARDREEFEAFDDDERAIEAWLARMAREDRERACACGGAGEATAAAAPGVGVSLAGGAAEITEFGGFGAARGWTSFDFEELVRPTGAPKDRVLPPGMESMPHRFAKPGVYFWYSASTPAVRGAIVVDFSPLKVDACGVCGGDGSSCLDCKGVPFGDAIKDSCGVCYSPTQDVSHVPDANVDCNGVCGGTAVSDDCGNCVGGSTGKLYNWAMDCDGVCGGFAPEFCGVCGITEGDAIEMELVDCGGDCFGSKKSNPCGICAGGDSGISPTEGVDCLGVCGGDAKRDCFGVCGGNATVDCAGTCGGLATINECGACVGGATGVDDLQTKKCDGTCASTPSEICANSDGNKRSIQAERECPDGVPVDCAGQCNGTAVSDKDSVCCDRSEIDCAGLCHGSAYVDGCGACAGGSSGHDETASVDCEGQCHGTAVYNPCGVCVRNQSEYYEGPGYRVDCTDTCGGSAFVDECGYCVDGATGLNANFAKDCDGVCDGPSISDDCGVCYNPAEGAHVRNQDMDCNGVCGGSAAIDDCGQCSGGNTGREVDSAKDCAGQCFGQHTFDDDACTCTGTLDLCFVCNGDNTTCAGCDGIPWSGKARDRCGLCGGDGSACCTNPFPQILVSIRDLSASWSRSILEAGETVRVVNNQLRETYTLLMLRTDVAADVARITNVRTEFDLGKVQPGHQKDFVVSQPGRYNLFAIESPAIGLSFDVVYNAKIRDLCGRCVAPSEAPDAYGNPYEETVVAVDVASPHDDDDDEAERLLDRKAIERAYDIDLEKMAAEYDTCCGLMESKEPSDWFTLVYDPKDPSTIPPGYVPPHSGNKRATPPPPAVLASAPASSDPAPFILPRSKHVAIVESLSVRVDRSTAAAKVAGDGRVWRLSLGDAFTFDNRDTIPHIISFSGPQPMADLSVQNGNYRTTDRFLVPGRYTFSSHKNLVAGTIVVEFHGICVKALAQEAADDDLSAGEIGGIAAGAGALVVLMAGLAAGAAVAVVVRKSKLVRRVQDDPSAADAEL